MRGPGRTRCRLAHLAEIGEVILTAHAGWSEDGRARGSSALEDWPDSIVRLTGDEAGARYLAVEGRDVEVEQQRLEFNPTTRRMTFAALPVNREQAREQARVSDLVSEVVAVVKSVRYPTASMIVDRIGGRRQRGFAAVIEATNRGLIREVKRGKKTVYREARPGDDLLRALDSGSREPSSDEPSPGQQTSPVPDSPYIGTGNREPERPGPHRRDLTRCSICGSTDGIVIENDDPRCRIHNPLIWKPGEGV